MKSEAQHEAYAVPRQTRTGAHASDSSAVRGYAVVDGGVDADWNMFAGSTRASAVSMPPRYREEGGSLTSEHLRWGARLGSMGAHNGHRARIEVWK